MPKVVHPTIRQQHLKALLTEGIPAKHALKASGYKDSVAHKSTSHPYVRVCQKQIEQELCFKNLTPERIIDGLVSELSSQDSKSADRIRVYELLGKHQRLWDTQPAQQTAIFAQILNQLPNKPNKTEPNTNNDKDLSKLT